MSDTVCKGCEKLFNTSTGYHKHTQSCKPYIKITQLENDLRLLKAVTNVTNRCTFMEENTDLVPKEYLKKCTLLGRNGLMRLCYYLYFAIPENRTVMYADKQPGKIWIWEERGWTLEDKNDSLEMMLDKTFELQANTYNSLKEVSSEKLEVWYNAQSKYYFLNIDKKGFVMELDAFITDFYTRQVLSPNFQIHRPINVKIIVPN